MNAIVQVLALLAEHADLLEVIFEALTGGVEKDALKKVIRSEMLKASDAVMKQQLDLE